MGREFSAAISGGVHHRIRVSGGQVYHSMFRAPSWTNFAAIPVPFGTAVDADCDGAGGELQVVVAASDGKIYHALRDTAGDWRGGNIETDAGDIPSVFDITCSEEGGRLWVYCYTSSGMYIAHRSPNGTWSRF